MHENRRNLQRKREKNRQKVANFRVGMLDGAECHFRDFCFDVEARSEIPAYKFFSPRRICFEIPVLAANQKPSCQKNPAF